MKVLGSHGHPRQFFFIQVTIKQKHLDINRWKALDSVCDWCKGQKDLLIGKICTLERTTFVAMITISSIQYLVVGTVVERLFSTCYNHFIPIIV